MFGSIVQVKMGVMSANEPKSHVSPTIELLLVVSGRIAAIRFPGVAFSESASLPTLVSRDAYPQVLSRRSAS